MHSGSYSSAERRSHDEDIRESRQDRSTSREEHRSSHFTSRMLLTKNAAKETETDALIIRNRIALLEKEEQKLLKHIDETKKRALDIISKKNRNKEIHNERDKKLEERAREIEVKRVQIINKKEELKERVQSALESRSLTSKEKAFEIKENMKVIVVQEETKGQVQRAATERAGHSHGASEGYKGNGDVGTK